MTPPAQKNASKEARIPLNSYNTSAREAFSVMQINSLDADLAHSFVIRVMGFKLINKM